MPVTSLDVIVLTGTQRQQLDRLIRAGTSAQRLVCRARIVLLAADGQPNTVISVRVGVSVDTVRKWRHRWCRSPGLDSLGDAKRSGRPPRFTPVQVPAAPPKTTPGAHCHTQPTESALEPARTAVTAPNKAPVKDRG